MIKFNRFLMILALLTPITLNAQQTSSREAKAVLVTTSKPYIAMTKPIIELTGSAYFTNTSKVAAESSGKVIKIFIEEGDNVKVGSPLIQLDDEMVRYSLNSAIAKTNQAKSNLEKAKRDYERNKRIYDQEAISLQVYENSLTDMQNALDSYNSLIADQKKLESEKTKMLIKSPISGSVTSRDLNIGEWVNGGGVVANIASNTYEAKIFLPERILPYIKKGDKVSLYSAEEDFEGEVLSINNKGEATTRTFLSRISLGASKALREGVLITARIPSGDNIQALFIGRDAIITRNFTKGVYIIVGDIAKFVPIKITGYKGKDIGVSGELTSNDNIILKGNDKVGDGTKVKIDNSNAQTKEVK